MELANDLSNRRLQKTLVDYIRNGVFPVGCFRRLLCLSFQDSEICENHPVFTARTRKPARRSE